MKHPPYALLATSVAALALASCSGEDYDPTAAGTDTPKVQGKVIEGQVASAENAPVPPEISPAPAEPQAEEGKSPPEREDESTQIFSDAQPSETNGSPESLIGQTLPPFEPAEDGPPPPSPPSPPPPESNLPPLPKDSPYKEVSFRSISSFPYEVEWETDGKEPDPTAFLKRVPPEVRKLSGIKVAVEGFMIPTMVNEENKVTEFLLLPDQMSCCYGKNPAANGWVVVNSQGTDILMDQMIRVTGSIVIEERWDEEFFVGLYHMSCDDITGPAL